ncbi:helix-turn-helix domain-containing protein [Kribbella yunnanensis]|uniref:Helix-turn-helix domain-containing protein n=1 Tax=Kribbella yunnanensis TaxID=190194 RepID=A0ABN2IWE4_9ACTN
METRGLQPIVDGLAERIGRNVAIDDPQIHLLAYSAQFGTTDVQRVHSIMQMRVDESLVKHVYREGIGVAQAPIRVSGIPEIEFLERLCFPVRCQGLLFGFLWIIDEDHSLPSESAELCMAAAAAAGEVLMRERFLNDERRLREAEVFGGLLSADDHVRAATYDEGLQGQLFGPAEACCCVLIRDMNSEHRNAAASSTALDHILRTLGQRIAPLSALAAVRDEEACGALLVHGDEQTIERLVEDSARALFREAVESLPGEFLPRVGVGSVERSVAQARLSYQNAKLATLIGAHVEDFAPVTMWSKLGVYQLLARFPGIETRETPLPPELRAVLADKGAEQMVETLETYLDLGGSVQASVKTLQLHRTTLYYRISRIEQLTGLSLSNGSDRLLLHIGLKLARLQGALPGQDHYAQPPSAL